MSKSKINKTMKSELNHLLNALKPKANAKTLDDFINKDNENWKLKAKAFSTSAGVYSFWWVKGRENFVSGLNRTIVKSGPGKSEITIEIEDDLIGANGNDSICLYIGKTAGSLQSRIGKHLRLKTMRDHSRGKKIFTEETVSTTGQLKRGMEELFLNEINVRDLICKNVAVTYVELDGDDNCLTRFYLENLAIGNCLPIINLDVER